jgi:asparagine synthase (glutamine-hydrolysing)
MPAPDVEKPGIRTSNHSGRFMCGIAGFILPASSADHRTALEGMAAAVYHRGPDDAGFWETVTRDARYQIGLAHRRLAIIDLANGRQPMANEDGSVQLVFNGEIYNFQQLRDELVSLGHRFVTSSDTETIVHAYEQWGDRCVEYFRGMFAFAIWDAVNERLFLARDHFGEKPLFLCGHNGKLLFASEIKSILAFPGVTAERDMQSVWDYFAYRYVPGPATLFKGISKLMPGSFAVWEKGRLRETRFYRPPDRVPWKEKELPRDPVAAFRDKLDQAVALRMISDVPFGAFLSGGIDSSALVALMARHSAQPIKTFSVGFKEAGYSELYYARAIAGQFRTDHHELLVSHHDLMAQLPDLVRFRDAPVAEPSDIPIYLLSLEARRTVKMVLTGEGSDEILGGYPKHVYENYVQWYQRLPRFIDSALLQPIIESLPYRFHRAKTAAVNLGLRSFEERMARWFGALSEREREQLIALNGHNRSAGLQLESVAANSALRRILYFDQVSWLPDNLLERGDRMTMAASLEARMPFVDHELAAYVSSLPDRYRVRGHSTKWILHEAMKPVLPKFVLQRSKVGFRLAVNEWFRGPMRDYLYDHLTGPDSITTAYYRRPALEKILGDHVAGRHNHEKLLWSLLNLEIWHRRYLGKVV